MIYVLYTPTLGYMVYEGTLHRSTCYGASDKNGRNYWVDDIKLLANPPYLEPHKDDHFYFDDSVTYGPFPSWESLTHYKDYPECFI